MRMIRPPSDELSPTGMDEFDRLTVNILGVLYDMFPKAAILRADDFYEQADDYALANMDGTMDFLRDEGFLKFSGSAGEGALFLNVQLTLQGLSVLKKVPNSLEPQKTIGDKVKNAVKIGTTEAFKEVVKTIIAEAIRN